MSIDVDDRISCVVQVRPVGYREEPDTTPQRFKGSVMQHLLWLHDRVIQANWSLDLQEKGLAGGQHPAR